MANNRQGPRQPLSRVRPKVASAKVASAKVASTKVAPVTPVKKNAGVSRAKGAKVPPSRGASARKRRSPSLANPALVYDRLRTL